MSGFPRRTGRWLLVVSFVVLFAALGAFVFSILPGDGPAPGAQLSTIPTRIAVVTGTVAPPTATASFTPTATAVLTITPPITPTSTVAPTAAVTPTPTPAPATIVLEGITIPARKATFLRNNDLWSVESGSGEQAVTAFGDVEAIFGWNQDGTKLLLGRGRKKQPGDMSDTTELWLFDWSTKQPRRLTTGSNVHVAAWSPVDDRIAYCEQDMGLRVVDLTGKVLIQVAKGLCRFTWSPDGTQIAVEVYEQAPKPGFYIEDTRLAIVNSRDGTSKVLSQLGGYYGFVWSVEGKHLLYQWMRANRPLGESLWHLADTVTSAIQRIDVTPSSAAVSPMRSPRADLVSYTIGETIYVMDFAGKSLFSVQAREPAWATWAPEGSTLVYRGAAGKLAVREFAVPPDSPTVGGDKPAPVLYAYQRTEFHFSSK